MHARVDFCASWREKLEVDRKPLILWRKSCPIKTIPACASVVPSFPPSTSGSDLPTLARLEADYIRQILARTGGNKSEAARILGIDRSSLWRKLKRLGDDQLQEDA